MGLRDGEERGRGLPSPVEENYTSLCLSLASSLLTRTRDEVHALFKDCAPVAETPATPASAVEDEIREIGSNPHALQVGEAADFVKTRDIRIEVRRIDEDSYDVTYFYGPASEVVLRRSPRSFEVFPARRA